MTVTWKNMFSLCKINIFPEEIMAMLGAQELSKNSLTTEENWKKKISDSRFHHNKSVKHIWIGSSQILLWALLFDNCDFI